MRRHGQDRSGAGYRQVAGASEYGIGPPGPVKYGEFHDWPRTS